MKRPRKSKVLVKKEGKENIAANFHPDSTSNVQADNQVQLPVQESFLDTHAAAQYYPYLHQNEYAQNYPHHMPYHPYFLTNANHQPHLGD